MNYRYSVRQCKSNKPKWLRSLTFWAYEYPTKDWEDLPDSHWKWKLGVVLEETIPRVVCAIYGHESTPDQCMMPSHDFCGVCMKSTPRDTNPFPRMNLVRPLRK